MDMVEAAPEMLPKTSRKSKPVLTFIPEQERAINHRYTLVLVSEQAAAFAAVAMESEMAEAYSPKGSVGRQSEIEEKMVVFCPTGAVVAGQQELCRLRLHLCAGFSDALPLGRDVSAAASTIVALLFWRVPRGDKSAVEEVIRDWQMRMAEINHVPADFRPFTVICTFGADAGQADVIGDFAARQGARLEGQMAFGDSCVDAVMESLQSVAEAAITRQKLRKHRSDSDERILDERTASRSCAVL